MENRMLSFCEFLMERINFARANDADFPATTDTGIIVFSEEAYKKYKVEGKTHGVESHAIKHLMEFEPKYVKQVIASCRNFLIDLLDKDKELDIRYYKSPTQVSKNKPKRIVSSASDGAFLNMLDLINDMKVKRQKLNPTENKMLKYINQLSQKYEEIIEKKLKNVVNLDDLSLDQIQGVLREKNSVVMFEIFDRGMAKTVYVDLRDDAMIIASPDYIRTMFVMDEPAMRYVQKKFRGAKFENYDVLRAFQGR